MDGLWDILRRTTDQRKRTDERTDIGDYIGPLRINRGPKYLFYTILSIWVRHMHNLETGQIQKHQQSIEQ